MVASLRITAVLPPDAWIAFPQLPYTEECSIVAVWVMPEVTTMPLFTLSEITLSRTSHLVGPWLLSAIMPVALSVISTWLNSALVGPLPFVPMLIPPPVAPLPLLVMPVFLTMSVDPDCATMPKALALAKFSKMQFSTMQTAPAPHSRPDEPAAAVTPLILRLRRTISPEPSENAVKL